MASSAGRRNILKELSAFDPAEQSNIQNALIRTPTSPEESLIQERGTRRKPATYNYDAPDPVFFKSPTNSPKKPPNFLRILSPPRTPLRSSPRKRLLLSPERLQDSEKRIASMSLSNKRPKLGPLEKVKPSPSLESSLKALSHSQLVELINSVIIDSAEIHQKIKEAYPVPDLTLVEEKLNTFQHNVFRSIPRNIWGSQDSAFCYLRVRTHLEVYKKECMEKLQELMESQHWPTVFQYIFLAWKCTDGLPDWENVSHNKTKVSCKKHLRSQCLIALKRAKLDQAALSELIERMEEFSHSEDDFVVCIDYARQLMTKLDCTV